MDLDDAALVKKHLPELDAIKVLTAYDEKTGEPVWEDREDGLTLRMLLSHTSGESVGSTEEQQSHGLIVHVGCRNGIPFQLAPHHEMADRHQAS